MEAGEGNGGLVVVYQSQVLTDRLLERSISAIKVNYILYAFSP